MRRALLRAYAVTGAGLLLTLAAAAYVFNRSVVHAPRGRLCSSCRHAAKDHYYPTMRHTW
jgi:hypothetical protein